MTKPGVDRPWIEPMFIAPGALIAMAPFRYLWNNEPGFVGRNLWFAFFTPLTVFMVVSVAMAYLMTVCWRWWKAR